MSLANVMLSSTRFGESCWSVSFSKPNEVQDRVAVFTLNCDVEA